MGVLHYIAAMKGNVEMSSLLITHGALVATKDNEGNTPLHAAVFNTHVKLALLFLRKEAPVNARNNDGTTALIAAAFLGLEKLVTTLLDAGADVTPTTTSYEFGGGTALDAAHTGGHNRIQQLLTHYKLDTKVVSFNVIYACRFLK
jgi:ankyrin repeat protein